MGEAVTKTIKPPRTTSRTRTSRNEVAITRPRTGRDLIQYRQTFARVLREVLDQMPDVPKQDAGRYRWLADRFGVGVGAPRKWLEGRALPAMDKFLEITETLGVSPQRLLRGEEPKYVDLSKLADSIALASTSQSDLVRIAPYTAGVAARFEDEPAIGINQNFLLNHLHIADNANAKLALVQCQGPEMAPTISPGDWVIFNEDAEAPLTEGLYVMRLRMTSGVYIRRCAMLGSGFVARCDNVKLKISDQSLRADSGINIVGPVVAIIRSPS